MIAGLPITAAVPAAVTALAGDEPVRPVWRNELGGLTFAIGDSADRYVKWTPVASGIDLNLEAARLRWAARYVPVPELLGSGFDQSGSWLVTRALAGCNAVDARWLASPAIAAQALGSGLRALHEALPVEGCPFSWAAVDRIAEAFRRADQGLLDPGEWHDEFAGQPVERLLSRVADPPSVDRLVVCHGDACAPNTILDESGWVAGFVDLGSLGMADRWADLAIGSWSLEWNYGPGYESIYFRAYGVDPDPERISYYRLLWDLGD